MSVDQFFDVLSVIENFLWVYIAFPMMVLLGVYLAYKSGFAQLRRFPNIVRIFTSLLRRKETSQEGVAPLKAFFAGVGGCVGIGNIVGIATAVQFGGPGALFWIWMTSLLGSLIKYAEVYLGMLYRVQNTDNSYSGGPMYFLPKAFNVKWVSTAFCVLMCLYGIEIFQFSVMTSSISAGLDCDRLPVSLVLLTLVIIASRGGVGRVGAICSAVIPLFIVLYLGMGMYVIASNLGELPKIFSEIFTYAFTPHAAVGGFAGSTILLTISHGLRRGCYSSDIGVGYASILHSESSIKKPQMQAALTIFDVFLDTILICSMSIMLVLLSGDWKENNDSIYLVQNALGKYFPHMDVFMPLFLFLLGYSTIIAYFCAGLKAARHIAPKWGSKIYYVYAACSLFIFSFVNTDQAQTVMTIVQAFLLILNVTGIYLLRKELSFDIKPYEEEVAVANNTIGDAQPILVEA